MTKDARARRAMPVGGLPEEIVVWEILVRLDPKSLFHCRAVCRAWRSLTSAREFLLAHHSHQPSLPIFSRAEYPSRFNYQDIVAFDHQAAEELHTIVKLDRRFHIEASCDGLIIISEHDITCTCLYVSNLATRQCELIGKPGDVHILGMYPHRPTGEYRLLLHLRSHKRYMQVDLLPEGQIGCYVFTLGSDEAPRYIGLPETASQRLKAPALVHDNLHWYRVHHRSQDNSMHNHIQSKYIIVFDTIAESFRQMSAPIVPSNSHAFEMDGMLGIYAHNKSAEIVDIWVLKNYKSEVWDLKYRIKLPVAEIKGQFEGHDDHWYAHVVSVDSDILLLVSFDRWVLHIDSDGKLVASFNLDGGGFYKSKFWLKQTLVPHTFFPALKSCARSAWPFFCVSVPSKRLGGEGRNAAMAADSTTPTGTDNKWTNQGEGRVIAKPTRIKHPNRRFVGPEWVNST